MKLHPFYRTPFHPFFTSVDRKEAAALVRQWRRSGHLARTERLVCGRRRGYIFYGRDGESASLVLKEERVAN